jgi:CheY-like chemotaxis protein
MTEHIVDPIVTRSYEFATSGVYAQATYQKTALALRTLENLVGRDAFARALKAYARAYAFEHPTGAAFFALLESDIGRDLDPFIGPAFYGRGAVDLAVIDVGCRELDGRQQCRVVTSNRGEVPVPYVVEIELADGARRRRELDAGPSHHAIELEVDAPVVAVTLDPDRRILLDEGGLAGEWRAGVKLEPPARIAARTQHFTQMLLGWVGL